MKTFEKRLKDLIIDLEVVEAPRKVEFFTKHYEFILPIGKDETATLYLSEEAFEELKAMTLDYNDEENIDGDI